MNFAAQQKPAVTFPSVQTVKTIVMEIVLNKKRGLPPPFFWSGISTSPHHKHIGTEVFESTETSIVDVLDVIVSKL